MAKFRKKPAAVEAWQWFKNGDHPEDGAEAPLREGEVVRFFRDPEHLGTIKCKCCDGLLHDHGWIDTLEGGHIVCPGDWVITGVKGEHYPCKPDIFKATYEGVSCIGDIRSTQDRFNEMAADLYLQYNIDITASGGDSIGQALFELWKRVRVLEGNRVS